MKLLRDHLYSSFAILLLSISTPFVSHAQTGKKELAFTFATRSISEGGLGLTGTEAENFAHWKSVNMSFEGVKAYLGRYALVFQKAILPATQQGYQMNPRNAQDFADDLTFKFSTRNGIQNYLERYSTAFKYLTEDVENHGLHLSTELANPFAKHICYLYETLRGIELYLNRHRIAWNFAITPAGETGLGMNEKDAFHYAQVQANNYSTVEGLIAFREKYRHYYKKGLGSLDTPFSSETIIQLRDKALRDAQFCNSTIHTTL